jgi:hypothetical protein
VESPFYFFPSLFRKRAGRIRAESPNTAPDAGRSGSPDKSAGFFAEKILKNKYCVLARDMA